MDIHSYLVLLLPLLPILLIVIRKSAKKEEARKTNLPPSPPGLPIIGNLHQLGKHPHRSLWELSQRYGPLMHLQLGRVPAVVVSSARMAEEVLRTHDLVFCSRPALTSMRRLSYNFSDVAFSPYNATWRELKKISLLKLLNPKMVEGFRLVREEEVERMMSRIASMAALSEPVDLTQLLHSLSNDIVCRASFGKIVHHDQEHGDAEKNRFHRIFLESQALFMAFFVADYFPWGGWLDVLSGLRARLEKNFVELDAFYQEVIEAHGHDTTRPTEEEEDFVDVLLRLQKEDPHLTMDHVKGVLMNIFIAGTDATSATLEFAMAELMRNPSAMSKAQEEVRRTMGKKGKVEESDLPRLDYLRSVVKETLRLHPVAPLLVPHETLGHVTIDGYDIPPKTRVIVNAWAIGREPSCWEKPDEFIPERFMGSAIDFRGHNFQFIPFGAGRRICPGLSFGVVIVELALANLLYGFNWEVPDGVLGKEGIDMDEGIGIAVHLKTSLRLKATEHKPSCMMWKGGAWMPALISNDEPLR